MLSQYRSRCPQSAKFYKILFFINFRTSFGNIPQNNFCFLPYFDILCEISENTSLLQNLLKEQAVNLAVKLLSNRDASKLPLQDYKELLVLVLFSFSVTIPNT